MTNKLKIELSDVLPSPLELSNFHILQKNQQSLLEIDIDKFEDQVALEEYYKACEALDIDGEVLLNSMILARIYYLANTEIEIVDGLSAVEEETFLDHDLKELAEKHSQETEEEDVVVFFVKPENSNEGIE